MMQAGRYYVGDLCYVMHPEWKEFCELTFSGHEFLDGEFQLKDGRRFASYGTAYGDGTYHSNYGTTHPVDAGLIGCIRVSDISEHYTEEQLKKFGAVVDFTHDFKTSEEDGTIRFDDLLIYTNVDDPYEEDYDYDEDYDE